MNRALTALSSAALLVLAADTTPAQVTLTPETGFTISSNGTDGAFFNPADPTPVPANLALASAGATAIADPALVTPHEISDLNNGEYGNEDAYISGGPSSRAIIDLAGTTLYNVTSFAFGRDNGNNVDDACGGQCTDRVLGLYDLYYTQVTSPDLNTAITGDPTTGFAHIASLNYTGNEDDVPGGGFTSYLRHEYLIAQGGNPVQASALRLDTPVGNAIDEIEIYGALVPEPTSLGLLALGGLLGLRRRSR